MFDLFEKLQELVEQGYDIEIRADSIHPSFPFTIKISKGNKHCSRAFDLIDSSDIDIGINQMIEALNEEEENLTQTSFWYTR